MPPVSVCTRRGALYPETMRRSSVRFARTTLPVLAIAACSLSPQTKRAQAVFDARETANRSSSAVDAIAFAQAIHTAYEQGDYTANFAQLSSDTLNAQYALERALGDGAADTASVLAWRGILYEDTGRVTEAREEYRKSFELRATFLVGSKLVPIYGSFHDAESVTNTCKRTYSALNRVVEQLAMIDRCKKELQPLVPAAQTLAWLDPQAAAWYARESERRDKAAVAEQEQRRLRKERAEQVAAYVQRCAATCHDRGVACQEGCRSGDPVCQDRCETQYDGCLDACETAAQKAVTPRPPRANPPASSSSKTTTRPPSPATTMAPSPRRATGHRTGSSGRAGAPA